jgi:hypothetical protein
MPAISGNRRTLLLTRNRERAVEMRLRFLLIPLVRA